MTADIRNVKNSQLVYQYSVALTHLLYLSLSPPPPSLFNFYFKCYAWPAKDLSGSDVVFFLVKLPFNYFSPSVPFIRVVLNPDLLLF